MEITAGFNKGQHWMRVTPDVGPAQDVRVIVSDAGGVIAIAG